MDNKLKSKIKLIFMDIDGTLRNSDRKLTEKTIESVKRIQSLGIEVVLCSGRNRNYTKKISQEVGASEYIISSNGADIYDYKNNKSVYNNFIDKKDCVKLYNIAEKNKLRFIMNVEDIRYVTNKIDKNKNDEILNMNIEKFVDNYNISQCIILDQNFDKMKKIENEINSINTISVINKSKSLEYETEPVDKERTYYDLVQKNTTKGNAIIKLCNYLNISLENTMAFGDSLNDIQMFEVVGIPVVMGNAVDEIKKYGKIIADTNDNNGVAKILDNIV